ncbi:MAG: 3-hydroxyacyl-ACP dehydratase [Psychromonas sp.]|nr:3-hydroxyacyl-ACP dehydratase [Psychromonas sp.]
MKQSQYKPTVIEQDIIDSETEKSATLLLQIDADIHYFQGHFNHYPLLAGVVQLDWAIYYAKKLLNCDSVFAGMEVIKFQQAILPKSQVLLSLRWEKEKQKLYFSYRSGKDNNHSSGRIKLDAL